MNKKLRANLMLLLTAFIWGSAFVAQSKGMDYVGPYTFNCVRNIIASAFLIPVIFLFDYLRAKNTSPEATDIKTAEEKKVERKTLIIGGVLCGTVLFVASSLQQIGIMYTTAGKAGFITALYIVIVPILGLFLGKKVRPIIWGCVAVAAIGLYLLCLKGDFNIGKGDFLVLLCAFVFSLHILVIDHFSPKTDGIRLSCIQFFVCFLFSAVMMFLSETPEISSILQSAMPILYTGILSSGVAYTLQIVAQKDTDPTVASLLLSLESVFAVLAGMIVLHEMLSGRETMGCLLMFAAIIAAQLPSKSKPALTD
ncbi:DMT family transporter [Clostridium aminobutyricum]|uniref:DMT family transporter n=1 Tax=Clostridium aminobutyricum TaxID=33953 RepID=A0A939DBS4_CLOAM|nr:DMT family transporter [Clostridium aminobutyricum]MBN7774363.1 DMT family transporter [Clostridium aminobutyricum]